MNIKYTGLYLLPFLLLACSFNAAAWEVTVYSNSRSDIAILSNLGKPSHVYAYGGAPDLGPSTPADCPVSASLNSTGENNLYSGEVQEINTSSTSYPSSDAKGHKALLMIEDTYLEVRELDIFGLCGLGIDFSGRYARNPRGATSFTESFTHILNLVYEDSLHRLDNEDTPTAIHNLKPFIAAIDTNNIVDDSNRKTIARILNDYGYMLQRSGSDREAVLIFRKVNSLDPSRTVAYLNLADSYWTLGCEVSAKSAYSKYENLMKSHRQDLKIPSRVKERRDERPFTQKADS